MDNSKYIEALDELIRYHQNSIAMLEGIKSEFVGKQTSAPKRESLEDMEKSHKGVPYRISRDPLELQR